MYVSKYDTGNFTWTRFLDVVYAGRGQFGDRLPRGGAQVGALPVEGYTSQLPAEWRPDIRNASHVVYHYGTPVAWVDGRNGSWVVPDVVYSVQTKAVQNRIRTFLGEGNYRTVVKP